MCVATALAPSYRTFSCVVHHTAEMQCSMRQHDSGRHAAQHGCMHALSMSTLQKIWNTCITIVVSCLYVLPTRGIEILIVRVNCLHASAGPRGEFNLAEGHPTLQSHTPPFGASALEKCFVVAFCLPSCSVRNDCAAVVATLALLLRCICLSACIAAEAVTSTTFQRFVS